MAAVLLDDVRFTRDPRRAFTAEELAARRRFPIPGFRQLESLPVTWTT